MDKRPAPTAATVSASTNTDPADDVLTVLLDLLRNANREVVATALNPKAAAAVENFRVIAHDLSTTRAFGGPLPAAPVSQRPRV